MQQLHEQRHCTHIFWRLGLLNCSRYMHKHDDFQKIQFLELLTKQSNRVRFIQKLLFIEQNHPYIKDRSAEHHELHLQNN